MVRVTYGLHFLAGCRLTLFVKSGKRLRDHHFLFSYISCDLGVIKQETTIMKHNANFENYAYIITV